MINIFRQIYLTKLWSVNEDEIEQEGMTTMFKWQAQENWRGGVQYQEGVAKGKKWRDFCVF